jgi:NADP-dependent 3-hydroxy acid dehydrogenase YdfG
MDTSPEARSSFGLSLTEIDNSAEQFFVVTVGSEAGQAVLDDTSVIAATKEAIESVETTLP